jgi:hypothetical protein
VDIVHKIERRKVTWIGYIKCSNCLLSPVFEEEGKGRRGIRRKQLLDDGKEIRTYWILRQEEQMEKSIWKKL